MSSPIFFIAIREFICDVTSDRVYRGSLLTLAGAPPSNLNWKDSHSPTLWLKVLDSQKVVAVDPESVHEIVPLIWSMLLAVTDAEERLTFYHDRKRLKEVTQLKDGDYVRVQVISSSGRKERGVLRYRGSVNQNQEILFGVQLLGSAEGKGFTDGSFRGQRYFECAENCGVFVPGSRLEWDGGELSVQKQVKMDNNPSGDKEGCVQRNRNSTKNVTFLSRGVGLQTPPGPVEKEQELQTPVEKGRDLPRPVEKGRDMLRAGEKDRDLPRAGERDQNIFRPGEKGRDISRAGERDQGVPRPGEKDRDLSRAGERDPGIPRPGDKNRAISRAGEKERDVPRAVEKEKDISRACERDQGVPRAGERDRDISRIGERDRIVSRAVEKDRGVSRVCEMSQDVPRAGEQDRDKSRAGQKNRDVPRAAEKDQELPGMGEKDKAEDDPQPLNNPLDVKEQEGPNHLPKDHHPPSSLYCPPGNGCLLPESETVSLGLELNSMVEVDDPPIYGVIRWIGHPINSPEPIAGLEMEEALSSAYTDGVYRGVRYFQCGANKALFVKLRNCRPDSRFYFLHGPTNLIQRCNSIVALQDYTSKRVEENTPPLTIKEASDRLLGWKKGIQGHCNSCYLDATLFCMFACSSVLDTMLLRPPDKNDSDSYISTRDLLRTEIVNPLRKDGYVCATKVMALRKILEAAGQSRGFTNEEKDPEEFLNQLFQVLRVEPLFYIRTPNKKPQGCIFYQIFMETRQPVNVPSVQQLLEGSMVTGDLKFTEVPSCLIIQMPRDGKNKMFPTIIPTLQLDITDLLEDAPRQCCICQSLAVLECPDCYEDPAITPGQIKQYCAICSTQVHLHRHRCGHQPREMTVPENVKGQIALQRQRLQLFAVLCIETSHYVAFIRSDSEDQPLWAFFDSMADREGGRNGFNIPKVAACPEVTEYLEMSPEQLEQEDPKSMPAYAHRLFCDAYMCLYYSPDLSLYK